jgi:hypothetical protein
MEVRGPADSRPAVCPGKMRPGPTGMDPGGPESIRSAMSVLASAPLPGRDLGWGLVQGYHLFAGSQLAGSQLAGSQLSAGVGLPFGKRGFLATRPDRRHDVQTFRCVARPSTTARTRCRFGCQTRRLALFAWLRRLPNWIPLLQISQTRDIDSSWGQDESRGYRFGGQLASGISSPLPSDHGLYGFGARHFTPAPFASVCAGGL